jgi:hypothetical protein
MAMPPRERQYITNWQLSIIAAARVHDLEFVRCLRLISQVMMPNSAPPVDLADHTKQDHYSDVDKQALVVWIKVLEDMADTGDSVLCREFREVCNKVFASQGLPDMMANAQGLIGSPAAPLSDKENAQGPDVDLEADEGGAGRSAKPEELAPGLPGPSVTSHLENHDSQTPHWAARSRRGSPVAPACPDRPRGRAGRTADCRRHHRLLRRP